MDSIRKIWRRLTGKSGGFPHQDYPDLDAAWQKFLASTGPFNFKVQVGARGSKIDEDWEVIDLYDNSDLIDFNYDLQHLPYEDNSLDVFVCKAILEHVPEPELAIYEMWRTLKPGGQIWIEIPFMQAFHAHPHDYWRVTLQGLKRWGEDFDEIESGVFEGFAREAFKMTSQWGSDVGLNVDEAENKAKEIFDYMSNLEKNGNYSQRLYTATWFWGKKPVDRTIAQKKKDYLKFLKASRIENK